jgi:hypothetical protein
MIFTYAGEGEAPAKLDGWTFRGHTTRGVCDVTLPAADLPPGARVWVTACWLSPRLEGGPASRPACARVPGWGTDGGEAEAGVKVVRRAA